MQIYKFTKCILCACIAVNVCAGYRTDIYSGRNKVDRYVMDLELRSYCNATIDVKDHFDEVQVRFFWRTVLIFRKAKPCWLTLHSRAFRYVNQLFSLSTSPGSYNGFNYGNRIEFARKTSSGSGTVPIPGIPSSIGSKGALLSAGTMTYSHEEDFVIKAYYDAPLRFTFNMKMHARDNDGRPMVSGVSKKISWSTVDAMHLDMKKNCGTTMVIAKRSRPVEVYYTHGQYSIADCRLTIRNDDDPFYRISMQFIEFSDLNGFCIYASNFEAIYNGARFCSGNPPSVHKTYTSLLGKRGFELRVNGSGSAFMSFRVLLTTFHTGECHSPRCDNGRCVPRSQLCKGAYPCGDGSADCHNPKTNSGDHLIIFCCVATGLALLLDCCCVMRAAKAAEIARNNRYIANREQEAGTTRAITDSTDNLHAVPSAPPEVDIELDAARASPSAPQPAPEADLPPSYDEVMSAEAKFGVNQDPIPSNRGVAS